MVETEYKKSKIVIKSKEENIDFSSKTNIPNIRNQIEKDKTPNKTLKKIFSFKDDLNNWCKYDEELFKRLKPYYIEKNKLNKNIVVKSKEEKIAVLAQTNNPMIRNQEVETLNKRLKKNFDFKYDLNNWFKEDEELIKRLKPYYKERKEINELKLINKDISELHLDIKIGTNILKDDSNDNMNKQL
ncbi:hypothetical protein MHBO_001611 [Bonamia ostreae]|uniref:Uncharacterized protein n=1 Tax=Bonamia ostreae TaxID=126728 RepID=A0ABV2AJL0_9EUKA